MHAKGISSKGNKNKTVPYTIPEVISMDKDKLEKRQQQKNQEQFNSVTQKVKPENQNQTHNVRSAAVEPKIRQV